MIRKNRLLWFALTIVLSWIAAGAGGPGRMARATDIERFADPQTSEDEVLSLIERIRYTTPTKDEATTWARVANSKEYSDIRRRRAVLQLLDRHVRPGMTLGNIADVLAKPSWLKRESVKVSQWVGGESIAVVLIQLPADDGSALSLRIGSGQMTEDLVYDTLQGKKTDATSRKVIAITVYPDTAEDRALVTLRAQKGRRRSPRPRHWAIAFAEGDLDLYARQLDFFGIDLGVITPDSKVVYAFHLSKPKPDTRVCDKPWLKERRYYLTDRSFRQADEKLFSRAGIEAGDRLILKFIPPAIEDQLSDLENSYPKDESGRKLKKTRFGIRPTGKGFSLYVIEQVRE
jgi:hypothetical protein